MTEQSYPVLIKCTDYRIIWVEAEDAKDAASIVDNDSEYISSSESYDASWEASAPDEWDWETLYGYSGAAPRNDAHVITHQAEMSRQKRAAKIAECAAAGHPDRQTFPNDADWCRSCSSYVAEESAR